MRKTTGCIDSITLHRSLLSKGVNFLDMGIFFQDGKVRTGAAGPFAWAGTAAKRRTRPKAARVFGHDDAVAPFSRHPIRARGLRRPALAGYAGQRSRIDPASGSSRPSEPTPAIMTVKTCRSVRSRGRAVESSPLRRPGGEDPPCSPGTGAGAAGGRHARGPGSGAPVMAWTRRPSPGWRRLRAVRAGGGAQQREDLRPVGRAQPGARVPARPRLEGAVGPLGDRVESAPRDDLGIEQRVEEPDRLAQLLVDQGDQTGPERRDGAGAADDRVQRRRPGPRSPNRDRRRPRRRGRPGRRSGPS